MAVFLSSRTMRRATCSALLLFAALVALADHDVAATGQPVNVDEVALARMMPPSEDLQPDIAGFAVDPASGFFQSAASGVQRGYGLAYFNPDPFNGSGLYGVILEALLYTTVGQASSNVTDAIDDLQGQIGDEFAPDLVLEEVTPFGVSGLGDEAAGAVLRFHYRGHTLVWTIAVFRIDRLVGDVTLARIDTDDVHGRAAQIAQRFDERMKGVFTGDVTAIDAPLPPDVNCADGANSIDAALILQRTAGLITTLRCQFLGDANNDAIIDSIDAAIVLQLDAGLTSWPL